MAEGICRLLDFGAVGAFFGILCERRARSLSRSSFSFASIGRRSSEISGVTALIFSARTISGESFNKHLFRFSCRLSFHLLDNFMTRYFRFARKALGWAALVRLKAPVLINNLSL